MARIRSRRSLALRLAALPLAFVLGVALSAVAAHAAPAGAPLVCFPIEVDAKAQLPAAPTPAQVVELLATNGDPQLHMEVLRRACMATEPPGREPRDAGREEQWRQLVGLLERATLLAAAEPDGRDAAARRTLALRFFDLGYALEVGETLRMELGDGAPFLRKSVELAPDDAALRFGVALPLFQDSMLARDEAAKTDAARACYAHLALAMKSDDARLRRNLVATFGAFLDCATHEELAAKARHQLGGV